MNKKDVMCDTYTKITKAIQTYKCKRNQDLGLVDANVSRKLNEAIQALGLQLDKVLGI